MNTDLIVLKDLFALAFSFFTQEFELWGFSVSFFGLAVALFVLSIPFIILERIADL